ncbi:hypothetical protein Tco_0488599 [Tanacetum coccineum]
MRSTGGINNESGRGGGGGDGRGGSGGDGRGGRGNVAGMSGGNGDEALNLPMAALKPGEGGDNEISGEDGGVGKARSLSTSSSGGNSTGASGRIDILAVVRHAGGDGGVAADSSVSNGSVSSEEGTWSTTGATTESAKQQPTIQTSKMPLYSLRRGSPTTIPGDREVRPVNYGTLRTGEGGCSGPRDVPGFPVRALNREMVVLSGRVAHSVGG